jgi:hypothetical protein
MSWLKDALFSTCRFANRFTKKRRPQEKTTNMPNEPLRSPCGLLESDLLRDPLAISVNDPGELGTGITSAVLQRRSDMAIEVKATGRMVAPEPPVARALKKGQMIPPSRPIAGEVFHTDAVHSVKGEAVVIGLSMPEKTINGLGDLTLSGMAAEVQTRWFNDAGTMSEEARHVEWLANFDVAPEILMRGTERTHGDLYRRERSPWSLIEMNAPSQSKSRGLASDFVAFDVSVSGTEWTLLVGRPELAWGTQAWKPGFVEFVSKSTVAVPDPETRNRVIVALSFALGRQLVPTGWTTFSADWRPVKATAVRPHFLGKTDTLGNPNVPPCDLSLRGQPILSEPALRAVTQCVLDAYDDGLDIEFPIWLVWLAQASPLDASPAHLGAAIEGLRERFEARTIKGKGTLLKKQDWAAVRDLLLEKLVEAVAKLEVPPDEPSLQILKNNVGRSNEKTSGARYPEFFQALPLPIGAVENAALRERNTPAHGKQYAPTQYEALKAAVDALHTLFHRIALTMLGYRGSYIDYSTLGHPSRQLADPLGGPNGDGKPAKV